jgi:hypothetical protein
MEGFQSRLGIVVTRGGQAWARAGGTSHARVEAVGDRGEDDRDPGAPADGRDDEIGMECPGTPQLTAATTRKRCGVASPAPAQPRHELKYAKVG